mgnify:FL=1|tara:strand:+ start:977 stop:1309 length:333 start_codon:yes stop_codon:yes gene_type:complete
MLSIKKYILITNVIFFTLFMLKITNVVLERIDIILFLLWAFPLITFYIFIIRLNIKSYQWFCFVLLIYFLSSSIRVFGASAFWLDVAELIFVSLLFIQIMFGPKIISRMN